MASKRVDSSSSHREIGSLVVVKQRIESSGGRPAYVVCKLMVVCPGAPVPLQISAVPFVVDGKPVASLRLGGSKIADLIPDPA
jgi:hypothetical protein